MTVMTTSSSMSVKPLLIRDTQHLFHRGDPSLHLPPAVLPQRHHALALAERAERPGVRGLQQLLLDLLGDDEQLEDPCPPPITGLPASGAAPPPLDRKS